MLVRVQHGIYGSHCFFFGHFEKVEKNLLRNGPFILALELIWSTLFMTGQQKNIPQRTCLFRTGLFTLATYQYPKDPVEKKKNVQNGKDSQDASIVMSCQRQAD